MDSTEEYKGCRNCKYQPEPMQTCDWIKHQKEVYRVCPMWELKKIKVVEQMIIEQYQKPFVPKYANYDYTKVYYGNDIFIGWIKIYYNQQEMESD